jgi:hypothetical protein
LFWSLLVLAPASSFGQSLRLSHPSAPPGEWISLEVSLRSPAGREPSTLQWEAAIPYGQLMLLEENLAGPAARAAGKNLSCVVKSKTETIYTTVCMLYGGQERIRNGVVARMRVRLAAEAREGDIRIGVANALAVLPDAQRIPIEPVETSIRIRKK